MMMNGKTKFPFTAAQWQELEHQALIYKHMVSGIPIPPELLYSMKRSYMDTPFSSKIFSCQSSPMGWSCFQMGLGRKIDPEPGRCRRTDGKKWRCSKEAYPDSKYCERHMHRGKNRSRKPVELATTPPKTTSNITSPSSSTLNFPSITKNPLPSFPTHQNQHSLSLFSHETHHAYKNNHHLNSEFMPYSSPSSRPGFGILDSGGGASSLINTEYRNRSTYGLKEEINEHAFFSEPSGSIGSLTNPSLDDTWQLAPLTMSTSSSSSNFSSSKQRNMLSSHNNYSYLQLQSLSDHETTLQKQYHHSFLQESDYLKGSLTSVVDKEEPQKTVHRFIEEWPPKNKEYSFLDLEDKSSSVSVSTTRLSISIPSSTHEFPIFNSRLHKDG